jgi:voltage-gated potassium channel
MKVDVIAAMRCYGLGTVAVWRFAIVGVGLGALATLDAKRNSPGANITTFGDGLWWAATTVTTVGYGDRYPVTTEGRFVAIALKVVGIAVVGSVTCCVSYHRVVRMKEAKSSNAMASPWVLQ